MIHMWCDRPLPGGLSALIHGQGHHLVIQWRSNILEAIIHATQGVRGHGLFDLAVMLGDLGFLARLQMVTEDLA